MLTWLLQGGTILSHTSLLGRTTTCRCASAISIGVRQRHNQSPRAVTSLLQFRDRGRRRSGATALFSSTEERDAIIAASSSSSIVNNSMQHGSSKEKQRDKKEPRTTTAAPSSNKKSHGRYGKLLQEVGLDHIISPDTDLSSARTVSTMDVFCNRGTLFCCFCFVTSSSSSY
jgi:hypothetical protein